MREETCPVCGHGTAREIIAESVVKVPGGKVTIPDDRYMRCDNEPCQETYYHDDQLAEREKKINQARRSLSRLLSPIEIVKIRHKFGLSQEQFEKLLGLGPKTLIRWEKGTQLQSVAADDVLRLIDRDPSALDYLAQLRGGGRTTPTRAGSRKSRTG